MLENVESFTFNGIDLADEFSDEQEGTYFVVNSVEGRGILGQETSRIYVPNRSGSYYGGRRMLERILTVQVKIGRAHV